MNSRESFNAISGWLNEAKDNVLEECIFCLIGNKSDMEREVDYEEGITFMRENKIDFFFETSAKNNDKVTEMFETTAQELLTKSLEIRTLKEKVDKDIRLQETPMRTNKNGGCC